jgi:L-malate glycosyltransferase
MNNILYIGEGSSFAGAESYMLNLVRGILAFDRSSVACALFYNGLLKDKLCEEGIRVFQLFGKDNFKSVRFLIHYIRKNHIQLVHLIDLKSTIVWGFAALFVRDVRAVSTVHGIPESYDSLYMRIKYGVSLALYYLVLRFFVDRIICVSADLAHRLRKKIGKRKVHVIHNGLDLKFSADAFDVQTLPKNKFIIGTVGRLDNVKGHSFFLESAARILGARNDAVFYIIGEGPLDNVLKEQAKSLGVADNVHFLGFREDVRALTTCMDVFVLPSLHEGIPYALLEAMSLSKPIVCTEVGGLKEVIENRVDGLLVPPKEPQALSQAVMALLDNPGYAAELGKRARRRIESEFSLDRMAMETCSIYEDLSGDRLRNTSDRNRDKH